MPIRAESLVAHVQECTIVNQLVEPSVLPDELLQSGNVLARHIRRFPSHMLRVSHAAYPGVVQLAPIARIYHDGTAQLLPDGIKDGRYQRHHILLSFVRQLPAAPALEFFFLEILHTISVLKSLHKHTDPFRYHFRHPSLIIIRRTPTAARIQKIHFNADTKGERLAAEPSETPTAFSTYTESTFWIYTVSVLTTTFSSLSRTAARSRILSLSVTTLLKSVSPTSFLSTVITVVSRRVSLTKTITSSRTVSLTSLTEELSTSLLLVAVRLTLQLVIHRARSAVRTITDFL